MCFSMLLLHPFLTFDVFLLPVVKCWVFLTNTSDFLFTFVQKHLENGPWSPIKQQKDVLTIPEW